MNMRNYNRIMLGRGSCFAEECVKGGYIGANFDIPQNLSKDLPDDWRVFNKKFVPVYMTNMPGKSKSAAGLSCGFLWTICKGLVIGSIVLSPDGNGNYYVGEIISDYYFVPGTDLPHRRNVKWMNKLIKRSDMSDSLRNSTGSIGTCCDVSRFADEIEDLIANSITTITIAKPSTTVKTHYLERDLHKVFCNYLRDNGIIGKTIYQEQSSTKKDSNQKWVHPDIVGVQFVDFVEDTTKSLQKAMEPKKTVSIYSYELKRTIEDDYQLKQYFFQALSNSNWANYGYLVAYEIDESLSDEIRRLNAAFGIGVILLRAKPEDTIVLYQAREKELDYNTIDKLCHLNEGFKKFISGMTNVMKATKDYVGASLEVFEKSCDEIFKNDAELEDYCKKNCIPF